jgi:hypothetical protein
MILGFLLSLNPCYSTWHFKDSKLEEYKVEQNIYLGKKYIYIYIYIYIFKANHHNGPAPIEAGSGPLKSLEYFGSKFLSNFL